jgi:hypothetical protein
MHLARTLLCFLDDACQKNARQREEQMKFLIAPAAPVFLMFVAYR